MYYRNLDWKSSRWCNEKIRWVLRYQFLSDTNCATFSSLTFKILNFSGPQISHLEIVDSNMFLDFLTGFFNIIREKMFTKLWWTIERYYFSLFITDRFSWFMVTIHMKILSCVNLGIMPSCLIKYQSKCCYVFFCLHFLCYYLNQ